MGDFEESEEVRSQAAALEAAHRDVLAKYISVLKEAKDYAQEALTWHDTELGRAHLHNRLIAERIEGDIERFNREIKRWTA